MSRLVDRPTMVRLGDANLVSYLAHLAHTASRGRLEQGSGYLLFAGTHPYPGTYTNGAIRTSGEVSPAELLERADGFFSPLRRGYMVWVRDHADPDLEVELKRRGLWLRPPEVGNPGIARDQPLPAELAPDADVRRVEDEAGLRDYLRVVAHGYGVGEAPDELLETILFSLDSLRSEKVAAFVAYEDERPLSGCMVYVAGGAAGLQWGATMPGARNRGLGRATFLAACNEGFSRGAVCATGQASEQGTPIWVRMGFEVVTRYRRYMVPPTRR